MPNILRRIKRQATHAMRLARAAMTDERIPAPIRWMIRVGVAVKLLPVPDFGVDEVLLGVAVLLLATAYRGRWAQVRADLV